MKRFYLFLLSFILFTVGSFAKEEAFDASLKKELLKKEFQTKIPLGLTYSIKDDEGYSAKLSVVNEIYPDEIRYFAKGGLKMATRKKWDGTTVLTPKMFSGRHVSLNEIETVPAGAIVQIKKIDIKGNQIEIELTTLSNQETNFKLMAIKNLDSEGIMSEIARVLKIDYMESLKPFTLKKQEAERMLNKATSIEEKFESLFEIKKAIEAILKIERLSSIFYSKYLNEKMEIDSKIEELYGLLKEPIVIVKSAILEPVAVRRGDVLNLEVKYLLVVPKAERQFKVKESINLSGRNIFLNLKKRESEKSEGEHIFSLQFMIPMGLESGEYSLITEIEVGGKKKIISRRFELEGGDYTKSSILSSQKKEEIVSPKLTVAGVFSISQSGESYEKSCIQPLVIYRNGKFYSLFSSFGETGISEKEIEKVKEVKQLLKSIKTFWLYDKGNLFGHFTVTGVTSGMIYPICSGDNIVLKGNVKWEKVYTQERFKQLVALSQPLNQKSFFLSEEILSREQIASLDRLLSSIIKNATGNCPKTILQKFIGKSPNKRLIEVLDIDNDGQPEFYMNADWENGYYMWISILASWKGNNWEVIKQTASCSGSEVEGASGFYIEVVADLDGDGVAELILDERYGETGNLVLYRLVGKQLKKVLEIGDYGL